MVTATCTSVAQLTKHLRAVLSALVFLVLSIVWVAHTGADMATIQAVIARLIATTFRSTFEVITAGYKDLFIRMVLTTQRQSTTHLSLLSQSVKDVAPQLNGAEHFHISDTIQTHLSTRKGNTYTV